MPFNCAACGCYSDADSLCLICGADKASVPAVAIATAEYDRNAHYEKLNQRSEIRFAVLSDMGFKYTRVEEWNCAFFVRPDPVRPGKRQTIPVTLVTNADCIVWDDLLNQYS